MRSGIRIGIDASNLRAGGGRTHLIELLGHAAGGALDGISEVVVWGSTETLSALPSRPWLRPVTPPLLDGPLALRGYWLARVLPQATRDLDVLFAPGGIALGSTCPTVVMCQNLLPFDASQRRRYHGRARLRLEALRCLQAASIRRASGVIYLSEATRRVIGSAARASPTQPSAVIAHGVSERFFLPPRAPIAPADLSRSRPFRIVCVSAVSRYKNHPALVRAVADVARHHPLKLVLIGAPSNPEDERALRRAILASGMSDVVVWTGGMPYAEIPEELARADAAVFPTSCETFAMAIAEAMAAALPVAVTRLPVLEEVVGDAGVYFDAPSEGEIAAVLRSLIEAPAERGRLSARARARAERFTWTEAAHATFAFLRQCAGADRPAPGLGARACGE